MPEQNSPILEQDIITRDDLLLLRDSFVKNFKEGSKILGDMSITDENYMKITQATMYSLENVFGINNEVVRVDGIKAEKENADSPSENK